MPGVVCGGESIGVPSAGATRLGREELSLALPIMVICSPIGELVRTRLLLRQLVRTRLTSAQFLSLAVADVGPGQVAEDSKALKPGLPARI